MQHRDNLRMEVVYRAVVEDFPMLKRHPNP